MLTNLIENRGKEFSNLLKIGDYLARSLRENVELFYVDHGKVTYVTESGSVIVGNYVFKPYLKLSNIQVDDASVLENEDAFNKVTSSKVSMILSNLIESDYNEAECSFDDLLSLFETKLSYDRIKRRLEEKTERFGEQTMIVTSPEFQKVEEIKDKIVEFLKTNKTIINIPEIKNGLKLASIVSKSFNLPRITIEELSESKTFSIKIPEKNSIYEHICRQELIAKEILEAKQNFDTTWASNELIADLASLVFEKKRAKIEEKVAEIVGKIPYFALATKGQISTILENCLALSDIEVSKKELISFVSTIFEMKKPVKNYVITLLNEKYGININNLSDIPTFSNLVKTETVILNSLGKLAPKNSVIKDSLLALAESLKHKNGSEAIDLVDFLNELFIEAGYKTNLNETSLMQYLDFNQVADDLGKIGTILKLIRPVLAGGAMGGAGGMGGTMGGGGMPQMGGAGTPPITKPLAGNEEGAGLEMPPELDPEGTPGDGPIGDAEEAANGAQMNDPTMGDMGAEEMPEEGGIPGEEEDPLAAGLEGGLEGGLDPTIGEEPEDPVSHVNGDDITNMVSAIEDLLASIKGEIGDPDMSMEDPMEGDVPIDDENPMQDGDIDPMAGGQPEGGESEGDGDFDNDGEEEGSDEGKPEAKPEKKEKKPPFKK